ncbi:MAG: hypothetical protein ACOYW3_12870 [Bacteroidota bacterium]
MTDSKKRKELALKIFIPLLVVWGIITIFKAGYAVGVWLYAVLH